MRKGVLRYDSGFGRWAFDQGDCRESLHCGEVLAIRIADRYLWGRIEMDNKQEWYIILQRNDISFTLRQGVWYPAQMR
jgi:hypothetical protein